MYNGDMRIVRAALAACALWAAGGCLGDGGTVNLTVEQAMGVSPPLSGFSATNATANFDSLGQTHFTASSSQGTLTMVVNGQPTAGEVLDLAAEHNFLSFDITGAGWASNGGMLAVDATNPYKVRFLAVPMLRGSGSAQGSFVFNGAGTFK
jgi:hypothetical protein